MTSDAVMYGFLDKVMHTFAGLYIWQYVTTLDFEWEVYRKLRPWRWSFIAYFLARFLALFAMILSLVGFNLTREHNCEAWLRTLLTFGWLGGVSASFIILLRAVAIWGRDIRVVASTGILWLAHLCAAFAAITKSRSRWNASAHSCTITGTAEFRWSLLTKFVSDLIILGIMICGVLHKRNATYLWNVLYFQGLFWILTAIMTDLPNVVLSFKNISEAWNIMFQYPQFTVMVIASSQAYRELFQYITSEPICPHDRHKPREMKRFSRDGQGVQVTVTKTIEFGVEYHPTVLGGEVPANTGDEESGSETSKGETIRRHELELQMMRDLETLY